jgi:hypothetical protein
MEKVHMYFFTQEKITGHRLCIQVCMFIYFLIKLSTKIGKNKNYALFLVN